MKLFQWIEDHHIQAVLFDMDGVLVDSEPFIAEASVLMFQRIHHTSVSPEDFLPFVGMGEDKFLQGVADQYGVPLSLPADKVSTYDIYLEIIQGRLLPIPGVVRFVHECRNRNLKTAVATSADHRKMDGNLNEIDLPPESFDTCITGDDIQRKKPDPETFLKAAANLNTPPDYCLVIEDALNGVQAAKAAGCRCLAISSSFSEDQLQQAGADRVIPHFLKRS
jgi:HAD superfamily hydrolase (TIGR01509 family)